MAANPLPRVYLIGTGGSISFIGDSRTDYINYNYHDRHLTIAELLARIPETAQFAEVLPEQYLNVGSGSVAPAHWLELARRCNAIFRSDPTAAGIAITHGTATLEETAYFLNLTVKDRRPVVITGAMRPPTGLATDVDINLMDCIRVAAAPQSAGRGALTVLNNEIQAARDVVKTNSYRLETFRSGELGCLGYADSDEQVVFYRTPVKAHTVAAEFAVDDLAELPRVDIAYAYAGADGVVIDALVNAGVSGLIAAGLGSGGSPPGFMAALKRAVRRNIPVVIATQTGNGRVVRSRRFTEDGYLAADNLTPKKARILLMLALTRTNAPAEIQRMLETY